MADFSVRSLASLEENASTARVLNLLGVWRRHGETEDYKENPFFRCEKLNRAIIVKHRLRRDEIDVFGGARTICTKLIMPLDIANLKLGGASIFVGERFFEERLARMAASTLDDVDVRLLRLLDQLPSLDPFLVREHLKRNTFSPAACYLEISASDLARMTAFVRREIEPLVALSLGEAGKSTSHTERLVSKILSNRTDEDTEPLRLTLRLQPDEYKEGVFCWRGFLYYKWLLNGIMDEIVGVVKSIKNVKPFGNVEAEAISSIAASQESIVLALKKSCAHVKMSLKTYDDAYAHLTGNESPVAFRQFLLASPRMFVDLGERLGGLQHIVSFWRYRFKRDEAPRAPVEELLDIFREFEASLSPAYEMNAQEPGGFSAPSLLPYGVLTPPPPMRGFPPRGATACRP